MASLTVFCPLGLCNRLRVLLSGLALAKAANRQFKMLWPLTPACAAPFDTLFETCWPVESVNAEAVAHLPYISGWFSQLPDLLAATESELVIGYSGWLVKPRRFSGHQPLMPYCQELFAELKPVPELQRAIDLFRQAHFRPTMIGVHLRRGDFVRVRPDIVGNTELALAAVDRFLKQFPDAGILLCTDDGAVDQDNGTLQSEGVRQRFVAHYGNRLVQTTPRTLDRRAPEAIQDALVDLWLLRSTDCLVGTGGSSFSQLAVWGRDMPHDMVAAGTPAYQRIERLARLTGLYILIKAMGHYHFKRRVPFPALARYYGHLPFRLASRFWQVIVRALYSRLQYKPQSASCLDTHDRARS